MRCVLYAIDAKKLAYTASLPPCANPKSSSVFLLSVRFRFFCSLIISDLKILMLLSIFKSLCSQYEQTLFSSGLFQGSALYPQWNNSLCLHENPLCLDCSSASKG